MRLTPSGLPISSPALENPLAAAESSQDQALTLEPLPQAGGRSVAL